MEPIFEFELIFAVAGARHLGDGDFGGAPAEVGLDGHRIVTRIQAQTGEAPTTRANHSGADVGQTIAAAGAGA